MTTNPTTSLLGYEKTTGGELSWLELKRDTKIMLQGFKMSSCAMLWRDPMLGLRRKQLFFMLRFGPDDVGLFVAWIC